MSATNLPLFERKTRYGVIWTDDLTGEMPPISPDEDTPAMVYTSYYLGKDRYRHAGDMVWSPGAGERHRVTGPAVIRLNGEVEYWLNNRQVTREEWLTHKSLYPPIPTRKTIRNYENTTGKPVFLEF